MKLKKPASKCEFATFTESYDLCEAADHSLHEHLLRDADLTLAKAINASHAAEKT